MTIVGSYEAKTHLPSLLARVAKGERFTITRHGVPIAVLEPVTNTGGMSVDQAVDRLIEIGKGKTLGGLTIRQLVEEGRRY